MRFTILGNYFNGSFSLPPTSGPDSVETINNKFSPANLADQLWFCPFDYRHVDEAITSSLNGFDLWRKLNINERIKYLQKYFALFVQKKENIAEALALETGRPHWDINKELNFSIASITHQIERFSTNNNGQTWNSNNSTLYRPIGPCLIIGPYRNPIETITGQMVAALLAGNSIILKPSAHTCYSSQLLIECFHEAQLPVGVINLVQGDTEISRRLLKEKDIRIIFFSGVKEDARDVMEMASRHFGRTISLNISGKNFAVINDFSNIQRTLDHSIRACFQSTGQRFDSTSLILINRKIHEEFITKFHEEAKKLIIDHPNQNISEQAWPFMGPLISAQTVNQYLTFVGMAKREQFEEIMRGKNLEREPRGHYVSPSIHFAEKMINKGHFLSSEIIGPSCTFIAYDDVEEAIAIVNNNEFGLVASIYTEQEEIMRKCVDDLYVGKVYFNLPTIYNDFSTPYTSTKNSGNMQGGNIGMVSSCLYTKAITTYGTHNGEDI
ncbi:MAG: hypothetical protein A2451_16035 [Bdellovibrionales bacterium RIFOXYC2_FULL_39_8]|nr:MAG: hypothetical protein A2451_16035 [Bdellovibrionales bacterium RIFOXYC2_FULL_39_8]